MVKSQMTDSEEQDLLEGLSFGDDQVIQEIADELGMTFKEVQEYLRPMREFAA